MTFQKEAAEKNQCRYVVVLARDAYIHSNEPLRSAIHHYEQVIGSELLMAMPESYPRMNDEFGNTKLTHGFMIFAKGILPGLDEVYKSWYAGVVAGEPAFPYLQQIVKATGLDQLHGSPIARLTPQLFTGPQGVFARRDQFKDPMFRLTLLEIVMQRMEQRTGCLTCDENYAHAFTWKKEGTISTSSLDPLPSHRDPSTDGHVLFA